MNRKLLYFAKYRWFLPVFFSSALLFLIICAMLYRVWYMHIVIYSQETIQMDLKNNNLKSQAQIPAHSVPLLEGVDSKTEWCVWDLQIFCNIMYSYQMYINKTYNRIFREEYDDRFRVISIAFHEHSSWIFSLFIFPLFLPECSNGLIDCVEISTLSNLRLITCLFFSANIS